MQGVFRKRNEEDTAVLERPTAQYPRKYEKSLSLKSPKPNNLHQLAAIRTRSKSTSNLNMSTNSRTRSTNTLPIPPPQVKRQPTESSAKTENQKEKEETTVNLPAAPARRKRYNRTASADNQLSSMVNKTKALSEADLLEAATTLKWPKEEYEKNDAELAKPCRLKTPEVCTEDYIRYEAPEPEEQQHKLEIQKVQTQLPAQQSSP